MIHHLFNMTDFTKQDFIIDFESPDFKQMTKIYGNDLFIYKIQLQLQPQELDAIRHINEFIRDLALKNK